MKSYVISTSFFLSGTIFSQLYLPNCFSLEAYHIHSPNDLYLAFSGRQAIRGICTATLHHGKRLCVKGSLIESFFVILLIPSNPRIVPCDNNYAHRFKERQNVSNGGGDD